MDWEEADRARKQLAREQGAVIKDWGGKLPIALVYPNSYYVGMSNLGIHAIYSLFNSYDDVLAERVFREKENISRQRPPIALESQRPLTDFAVLAFSVSYELDYFHIPQLLRASGIPLYASERDETHPLIIAGGPCVTANPLPLAPFFDCLCIGEAEPIIPNLLPLLKEGIAAKRAELLKSLSSAPGVYVPAVAQGNPVIRQWAKRLDNFPVHSVIMTPDTELGDLYLIEVERGCPWHCRFCLVSNSFHPFRSHSLESLLEQAEEGLKYRRRLGLMGAAVTDHPRIEELLEGLLQRGAALSVSSLRTSSITEEIVAALVKGKAENITIAPEAGSERLRQVINKGINEDDILKTAAMAAEQGIKHLKLYYMIGLPTETEEDIREITRLTMDCKNILDKRRRGSRITINVSPFVPKAGTLFQWLPMAETALLNHRLSLLKNSLQPKGIKIKSESPFWSEVQAVLSRGDATLAPVLADIRRISMAGWAQAVKKHRLDVDFLAHRRWNTGKTLPWAIIDSGISTEHLEVELHRALSGS
jgi:radical SAM superfamily enzyme YgiQ (UPF0313 family)